MPCAALVHARLAAACCSTLPQFSATDSNFKRLSRGCSRHCNGTARGKRLQRVRLAVRRVNKARERRGGTFRNDRAGRAGCPLDAVRAVAWFALKPVDTATPVRNCGPRQPIMQQRGRAAHDAQTHTGWPSPPLRSQVNSIEVSRWNPLPHAAPLCMSIFRMLPTMLGRPTVPMLRCVLPSIWHAAASSSQPVVPTRFDAPCTRPRHTLITTS
jgi:hypothetical protein